VTDPVGAGLVDSLARPGANITGFSGIEAILAGKRLELLKETIPNISRVASAVESAGPKLNATMESKPTQDRNWACNFIEWRSAVPTNTKARSKRQLGRVATLLP
jgi:ABC transporter substrate binding protein